MHFDGFNTIEGRHLVFAYALVILMQAGYAGWVALNRLRLAPAEAGADTQKKATKPTV